MADDSCSLRIIVHRVSRRYLASLWPDCMLFRRFDAKRSDDIGPRRMNGSATWTSILGMTKDGQTKYSRRISVGGRSNLRTVRSPGKVQARCVGSVEHDKVDGLMGSDSIRASCKRSRTGKEQGDRKRILKTLEGTFPRFFRSATIKGLYVEWGPL